MRVYRIPEETYDYTYHSVDPEYGAHQKEAEVPQEIWDRLSKAEDALNAARLEMSKYFKQPT